MDFDKSKLTPGSALSEFVDVVNSQFSVVDGEIGLVNEQLSSEIDSINQTLPTKADKVANAATGNVAGLDVNGNLTDSGVPASEIVVSTSVKNIVVLTQAQYDALTTKDANTEYNII